MSFADEPMPPRRDWRTPLLSDWELLLNGKVYRVHRAILGEGERRSDLLLDLFQQDAGGSSSSSQTDLTTLLPDRCWPAFETLLDYAYELSNLEITDPVTAVKVCQMANVLKMPALASRAGHGRRLAAERRRA